MLINEGQHGLTCEISRAEEFSHFVSKYTQCIGDIIENERAVTPFVGHPEWAGTILLSADDQPDIIGELARLDHVHCHTLGISIHPANEQVINLTDHEIEERAIWDLAHFISKAHDDMDFESVLDDGMGTGPILLQMAIAGVLVRAYELKRKGESGVLMMADIFARGIQEIAHKRNTARSSLNNLFLRYPFLQATVDNIGEAIYKADVNRPMSVEAVKEMGACIRRVATMNSIAHKSAAIRIAS